MAKLNATLTNVVSTLQSLTKDLAANVAPNPQNVVDAAAAELQAILPISTAAIDKLTSRFFLYSWMTVMLVTFAEAYLEGALDTLVSTGLAASALPQDVNDEMKRKWIRDILRTGRPHEWIKQFKRLGVTGYSEDLAEQMRAIWIAATRLSTRPNPNFSKVTLKSFWRQQSFIEAIDVLVQQSLSVAVDPLIA